MSLEPLPVEVGDGQLDGLVGLVVRPESAVAVADQDQHVAVGVADQQVELAVARQVGDRQAVGFRRHRVGGRGQEPALAVAQVDAQPVGGEHGQVLDPIAGEVGHADDLGRARGLDGHGIGEAAAAQTGEDVERVRARVDRHQVGRTARDGAARRPRPPSPPGW